MCAAHMTGVAKIRAHGQNTAVSAVNKGTVSASNANIAQLLTTQNSLLQQQSKTPPAAAAEAAGAAEAPTMPTLNPPDAAHHPIQHAPHVQ